MDKKPRFRHVPVGFLDVIIKSLSMLGVVSSKMAGKAELARIGRYYATESMLHYDAAAQKYDADATPSTGTEHIFQFYEHLIKSRDSVDLGNHSVF